MSIVVDSSVLVAAAADAGPQGSWAEAVVENNPLAAPHLILVEATNILRRLELASRLITLEAISAGRDLRLLDIDLFPFEPFAERIWELRFNLTSYDAATSPSPKPSMFQSIDASPSHRACLASSGFRRSNHWIKQPGTKAPIPRDPQTTDHKLQSPQ